MTPETWQDQFDRELSAAENARRQGLEGQARVCARRAAGAALREYHLRKVGSGTIISAYDLIRLLAENQDTPAEARKILDLLQMRVLPGGQFPLEVDIIGLVRRLPELLEIN